MNLDSHVPPFFSRFERTLEFVNKDTEVQAAGRERYLFYKQRGYPLNHPVMKNALFITICNQWSIHFPDDSGMA